MAQLWNNGHKKKKEKKRKINGLIKIIWFLLRVECFCVCVQIVWHPSQEAHWDQPYSYWEFKKKKWNKVKCERSSSLLGTLLHMQFPGEALRGH